jgi:hypothetical protein
MQLHANYMLPKMLMDTVTVTVTCRMLQRGAQACPGPGRRPGACHCAGHSHRSTGTDHGPTVTATGPGPGGGPGPVTPRSHGSTSVRAQAIPSHVQPVSKAYRKCCVKFRTTPSLLTGLTLI